MKVRHLIPYYRELVFCTLRDWRRHPYGMDRLDADLFLSGGLDCTPALQLRRHKLRICSSPLDWMMGYRLADAAELYRTRFETFFQDIREHPHDSRNRRKVEDLRHNVISIHHFPLHMTLEEGQRYVRDRVRRHFEHTHDFLSKASRYVVVAKSNESREDITQFTDVMRSLYKGDIVFMNISESKRRSLTITVLANAVLLYAFTFDDRSILDKRGIKGRNHYGNDYEWGLIFDRCQRSGRFKTRSSKSAERYD
ncbi:MAG: papain-like cysteine peptidase [Planctomycetaceae bacterium]|nr:papain-like cysteine peptidase [Planctomycetaceae bacterium]